MIINYMKSIKRDIRNSKLYLEEIKQTHYTFVFLCRYINIKNFKGTNVLSGAKLELQIKVKITAYGISKC